MRRLVLRSLAIECVLLMACAVLGPVPARAAAGFDSAYKFESAFLTGLRPGDTGQLAVFFENTGTATWIVGSGTEVDLAACRMDQVTCNVPSDMSSWNPGTWLSPSAYATHGKSAVPPGDFSAFSYAVKVPSGAGVGTYRFNGDLVAAGTGERIHPQGYYQDVGVIALVIPPGAAAPSDVRTLIGNFNAAQNAPSDDVRITFTAPASNTIQSYDLQRASAACAITATSDAFATIATLSAVPGELVDTRDFDRPSGSYCYQVRTKEPATATYAYSNQDTAIVSVAVDTTKPTATSAVLTSSGGNPGALDAADAFTITFSEVIQLSATVATTIRVTDADCGAPGSQNSGPAGCPVDTHQTVADILCGTNAICFLSFDRKTLNVTMTGAPLIAIEGTVLGVQFPVVVTDSIGIADLAGNPWDLALSNDRTFGPLGQ